jgi:hypothetical protein
MIAVWFEMIKDKGISTREGDDFYKKQKTENGKLYRGEPV